MSVPERAGQGLDESEYHIVILREKMGRAEEGGWAKESPNLMIENMIWWRLEGERG